MEYETILTETRGKVGLVTLNRPQALNALNSQVLQDVLSALQAFDGDEGIGAIVLTGSEKAFAAGADIKEMQPLSYADAYLGDFFSGWDALSIKPALNAKVAMRFDYGRLNQTISAIECGLTEEYYFSKIPLVFMVTQHNFFFNAYVQIMFGSRK